LLLVVLLAACSAGANPETGVAAADGNVAGFWLGLWHGLIAPITFVISLFKDTVNIYDVHNNGNWYDFGFVLGLSSAFGGSCGGARRRRR
jgi:hypothetical protein